MVPTVHLCFHMSIEEIIFEDIIFPDVILSNCIDLPECKKYYPDYLIVPRHKSCYNLKKERE